MGIGGMEMGEHADDGEQQQRAAQRGKNAIAATNSLPFCALCLLCSFCLFRVILICLFCLLAFLHCFCPPVACIFPLTIMHEISKVCHG
jgi:hypothetical protein